MNPYAPTSPMMVSRVTVTGLRVHLELLLVLPSSQALTLPMKRSPCAGCACNLCHHTKTLWLSWGVPFKWFHGLPSWQEKFLLYLPLLLPQSACFLRLVILWPKNGPHEPAIILRNSFTYTRFGQKWGSGWPSRRLTRHSCYTLPTNARAHTHKHTNSYTKNPLGRIPCFFIVTNNKYQKRRRIHVPGSPDSFFLLYKYMYTSKWLSWYL